MKNISKISLIIPKLKEIENINFGIIEEFKDGCATIIGLKNVFIGEKLQLLNSTGIASVFSIDKNNNVYALVYTGGNAIIQGTLVIWTKKTLDITIDWSILGKIIRPF